MFCATGTQQCYTKASKGDLLPGQGGFAAKGKLGEALPPCAVIRAAVRVKLSAFPLLFAVQSSCAAQLIWRGFQRRTLGFAADKVTRYVAFLSGRCCLWEWSICRTGHLRRCEFRQIFYCKKRAAVRQNCLIQQLFFCVVIPALPAAPARSRCSGTCRWSSAQRSGRTLPQWRRCSGGCGILQCSQGAWGASAFPCARPCRFQ